MIRASRIVRVIWAVCLLLAGLNHARILWDHGLSWDYHGVGRFSAAYWSSLTVVDPVAAMLLFVRPRMGIVMSAVVIVTNVIHNLAVTVRHVPEGELTKRILSDPMILSQTGFMMVVAATAPVAWRGVRHRHRPSRLVTPPV